MLTHVVMVKLKQADEQTLKKTKQVFENMEGKIPELRSIEVGIDILRSERSYDIVLITTFDSMEDMQAYQVHPVHKEVIEYLNTVKESSIAVDYERP